MKPSEMRRKLQACRCEHCFYCDEPLSRHEHDHFPVPRTAGGTRRVATCLDCHDVKDRIPLHKWDVSATWIAMSELLQDVDLTRYKGLSQDELLKALWEDAGLSETAINARWDAMSSLSRVLYAKLRFMHEEAQLYREPPS